MRKYISLIAVMLLSVSTLSFAQEPSFEENSVESKITQANAQANSTAEALQILLAADSDILSDVQKTALAALPQEAQAFFIETVVSGELATDAALTTATTQAGVTSDMGTDLYDAFAPMLVDIDDDTNQGNLLQTAAAAGATGPIGFGTGAGGAGGGGGGAAASSN